MTDGRPSRLGVARSLRRRSPLGWLAILGVGVLATMLVAWRPWILRNEPVVREDVIVAGVGEHAYALNVASGGRAREHVWVLSWRRLEALGEGGREVVEPLPRWMPRLPFASPGRFGLRLTNEVEIYGWPMRCLFAVRGVSATEPGYVYRRAVVVPLGRRPTDDLVLSYGVLWAGMLVNVAVFTGATLVVWEALAFARRMRRRRHGRCAWCGYDRAGAPEDVCPECGVTA